MAKQLDFITTDLQEFIEQQKIFFVATARAEGRVNLSPKGLDSLKIINPNKVIWLNYTGSGNETAAHLLEHNRMTIMFCSFDAKPLILRLYGTAKTYHERDEKFKEYLPLFSDTLGTRQIFEMQVELVQTSCGFAVPLMEFQEERPLLKSWSTNKGETGIKNYWADKNQQSIDGFETGII